jgi:predicted nucleic acid-binding protein
MLYVDTSVIVSALTNEADTALAQIWLARQETSELTISDWTTTEFASALSIKLRDGRPRRRRSRGHAFGIYAPLRRKHSDAPGGA